MRIAALLSGGSSRPLHVLDAAGAGWYLRCAGAADFAGDAIAEILAWSLAPAFGVRVDPPCWMDLSALTLDAGSDAELADDLARSRGLGLGRPWIDGQPAAPGHRPGEPGLFLLDLALLNGDRRRRHPDLVVTPEGERPVDFAAGLLARRGPMRDCAPDREPDHPLWRGLRDHARLPNAEAIDSWLDTWRPPDPDEIAGAVEDFCRDDLAPPEDLRQRLAARLDPEHLAAEARWICTLAEPDPEAERRRIEARREAVRARLAWLQRPR